MFFSVLKVLETLSIDEKLGSFDFPSGSQAAIYLLVTKKKKN